MSGQSKAIGKGLGPLSDCLQVGWNSRKCSKDVRHFLHDSFCLLVCQAAAVQFWSKFDNLFGKLLL